MIWNKALANAVRFLSIDAVQKAQSGHPGMPLGMADIATVLWRGFLKHNPTNPHWFNRDRFILSNGHGSMLQYALLHLTGYALTIEDLKQFRQLHSKTPGHPEYRLTPGVEMTTGPLGQGLAAAVGMAIVEKHLAQVFNRPRLPIVDHYTYVFVGDGCLMEGISHEVCSLAGTLQLGKLIVFYDDNGISIDGKVENWFTDDTMMRFKAYHWHVVDPIDGHDSKAIEKAIHIAQRDERPSLIVCKTHIGLGSPQQDNETVHGSPLGEAHIAATRAYFGWPYLPFEIPTDLYQAWNHVDQGDQEEATWLTLCEAYEAAYPELYTAFLRQINGDLPDHWQHAARVFLTSCMKQEKPLATRQCSQICLNYWGKILPELFGGSADLSSSNLTQHNYSRAFSKKDLSGNYLFYGVREFGMVGIMNGIALHGGIIPYGGTFLVFSDYARNAIRLSALMGIRVIYVLTHDSIGLGEDGPTHQPIEHAAMLRMTPGLEVWRPADLLETAVAWQMALERHDGPTALLLSRQALPALNAKIQDVSWIYRGAYIVYDTAEPALILIATGSEVQLALACAQRLTDKIPIRVVSMLCCERFLSQTRSYQNQILPRHIKWRIAIEAAATPYWYRFVGLEGQVIGIDQFGASAKAQDLFTYYGLTVEHLIEVCLEKYYGSQCGN